MGRRPQKPYKVWSEQRKIINWHITLEEKQRIMEQYDHNTNCLNGYMKESLLDQSIVVRGSAFNRDKLINRIRQIDPLLEELERSSTLTAEERAELAMIKEIRRSWDVEEKRVS